MITSQSIAIYRYDDISGYGEIVVGRLSLSVSAMKTEPREYQPKTQKSRHSKY